MLARQPDTGVRSVPGGSGGRMAAAIERSSVVVVRMLNLEFTDGREYDRYRREPNDMVQLRGVLRF